MIICITDSLQNAKSLTIFEDLVVQGQGLVVRGQGQGLEIGPRRSSRTTRTFLENNNTGLSVHFCQRYAKVITIARLPANLYNYVMFMLCVSTTFSTSITRRRRHRGGRPHSWRGGAKRSFPPNTYLHRKRSLCSIRR